MVEEFKKILVYRVGHLGDTLVSLPAFWAIRNAFPKARITLLTNSNPKNPNYVLAKDVLPTRELFDEVLSYHSESKSLDKIYTFGKLFLQLKLAGYDAVIYLTTRNRTLGQISRDAGFFRKAGIKNIFGVEYLTKKLLDENAPRPLPVIESELDFLLDCLRFDKILDENAKFAPEMRLNSEEKKSARKWLEENTGEYLNENKLLAVAPSGKWNSKIWFEQSFSDVVSNLIDSKDVYPVVFGGAEDFEKGRRLIDSWGRGANAAGSLDIRQAAAALEVCRLYLGNDTGTMHLAASVGTRCVAVFSAIDWAGRWIPYGENHRIFRQTVPCEGCLSEVCKFERECLTAIDERKVFQACLDLWNS